MTSLSNPRPAAPDAATQFLPVSQPFLDGNEEAYLLDAVRSGWVSSLGPYIDRLEAQFSAYIGTRYALTASNGTTGLHLALASLGIGPGDEVVVADLSFIASANAIRYTGATPVFADIDPDTLCMDPDSVRALLTKRTKAVMPVHLYGHPADMDPILAIAAEHGLKVIEDAAESHGATYKGRRVGTFGDIAMFSLYGNKIITSGEGGLLTTNDPAIHARAKFLRDQAMSSERRYWHAEVGFNYRMTNLQAALGLAQLEQVDKFLRLRAQVLQWYREGLQSDSGLRLNYQAPWAQLAVWMVCLEVDGFNDALRAQFMKLMRQQGVDSRPYFYPMSSMPMYQGVTPPVTARKSAMGLNLPTYPGLSQADVQRVCDCVKSTLRQLGLR